MRAVLQASGVRELLEAKGSLGREGREGSPRVGGLFVRKGERHSTGEEERRRGGEEEEVVLGGEEEEIHGSHTLPRSHKAARIKSEWEELMARCSEGEGWSSHTLPRTGSRGEEGVRRILTVQVVEHRATLEPALTPSHQEKLHTEDVPPPPAELYVNLLEEEESTMR